MQSTFRYRDKSIGITFHEPAGGASQSTPALILAHGAGGNTDFWLERLTPFLNRLGIAVYAPHYFEATNTLRPDLRTITDGVHAPQWIATLDGALSWVAARATVDPERIALIGISLGSFLSLALAAQHSASADAATRRAIRCVVDISGGLISPHAEQATRHFPPTLILHGQNDTTVPVSSARALDKLLTGLAVPHETRLLPGEGHWFSGAAQAQLLLAVSHFLSRYL